jgi:hypothetical protein
MQKNESKWLLFLKDFAFWVLVPCPFFHMLIFTCYFLLMDLAFSDNIHYNLPHCLYLEAEHFSPDSLCWRSSSGWVVVVGSWNLAMMGMPRSAIVSLMASTNKKEICFNATFCAYWDNLSMKIGMLCSQFGMIDKLSCQVCTLTCSVTSTHPWSASHIGFGLLTHDKECPILANQVALQH